MANSSSDGDRRSRRYAAEDRTRPRARSRPTSTLGPSRRTSGTPTVSAAWGVRQAWLTFLWQGLFRRVQRQALLPPPMPPLARLDHGPAQPRHRSKPAGKIIRSRDGQPQVSPAGCGLVGAAGGQRPHLHRRRRGRESHTSTALCSALTRTPARSSGFSAPISLSATGSISLISFPKKSCAIFRCRPASPCFMERRCDGLLGMGLHRL